MKINRFVSTTEDDDIAWCIHQYEKANHKYDGCLPYEFHLRLVANICKKYFYLQQKIDAQAYINSYVVACFGHDLLEDTTTNYSDLVRRFGSGSYEDINVAEVIFAVTNSKGRNRKEREDEAYYKGMIETKGAVFVKLCDRLANIKYSALISSDNSKLEMYRKEYPIFVDKLKDFVEIYKPMFEEMKFLLNQDR